MSKYESAYKFIELCVKPWIHKEDLDKPLNTQKWDNLNILKEAVEKANKFDEKEARMKIIKDVVDSDGEPYLPRNTGLCPKCHSIVSLMDRYCPNCGQRIDTIVGDEDEYGKK